MFLDKTFTVNNFICIRACVKAVLDNAPAIEDMPLAHQELCHQFDMDPKTEITEADEWLGYVEAMGNGEIPLEPIIVEQDVIRTCLAAVNICHAEMHDAEETRPEGFEYDKDQMTLLCDTHQKLTRYWLQQTQLDQYLSDNINLN